MLLVVAAAGRSCWSIGNLFSSQLQPGRQTREGGSWVLDWGTRKRVASKKGARQGNTKAKRTCIGNGDGDESRSRSQTSRSKAGTVNKATNKRPTVYAKSISTNLVTRQLTMKSKNAYGWLKWKWRIPVGRGIPVHSSLPLAIRCRLPGPQLRLYRINTISEQGNKSHWAGREKERIG